MNRVTVHLNLDHQAVMPLPPEEQQNRDRPEG